MIGWSQTHPLYKQDRELVDQLLAESPPSDDELTTAGRLLIRYRGFPGAEDIKSDLSAVLKQWGMTRDELNRRCIQIWSTGYRPGQLDQGLTVGSGADSND